MTVSITELYDSLRWTDANALQGFRRFFVRGDASTPVSQANVWNDMVTGPGADTTPVGGLPQRGESHPIEPKMIADSRVVEAVVPNAVYVRVNYQRVSWGEVDTFYTGDTETPPYIKVSTQSRVENISVPFVVRYPVVGTGGSFVDSYAIMTEPRKRPTTIVTATLHQSTFGPIQWAAAAAQTNYLHPEVSFGPGSPALFLGYSHEPIGKSLHRVTYQWTVQDFLTSLGDEVILTTQGEDITRLQVPEVEPFSNITPIRIPRLTNVADDGPEVPPVFIPTEPIANLQTGSITSLPGLELVSTLDVNP